MGTNNVSIMNAMPEGGEIFIGEAVVAAKQTLLPPVKQYETTEIRDHISEFDPKAQPIIERWLRGEKRMPEDDKTFRDAVDTWWEQQYGFPYSQKTARNEALLQKYEPETVKDRKALQEHLLSVINTGNEPRITRFKLEYMHAYPDQIEGVEVIFGLRDYLKKVSELDTLKLWHHREPLIKDLTEYKFLMTHFLMANTADSAFLKLFWKTAEKIARRASSEKELAMLRTEMASQLAVHTILRTLGKNPKLALPEEDAYHAIDLWADVGEAVQIMTSERQDAAVIETDVIAFPAARTDTEYVRQFFSGQEWISRKNKAFRTKVDLYARRMGRTINAYMLVIPLNQIDRLTGEPSADLVNFFRQEFGKKGLLGETEGASV